MELTLTIHDGKTSVPVTLETQGGFIRIVGLHGRRNDLSFIGQPEQTWRDRLVNWWRLSFASKKHLRCAFEQVYLTPSHDAEKLIIDPGWSDEPLVMNTAGKGKAVLAEWTKGKLHWLRGKEVRYAANRDGFSILETETGTLVTAVSWEDVRAIRGYKRDFFAYDMICLGFQLADTSWIEIWEESDGFLQVSEAVQEVYPDIPDKWYDNVMMPPFATNDTLLYRQSQEWGEWQG